MSSSGVGRGRGWLHLNKNSTAASVPRPGDTANLPKNNCNPISPHLVESKQFSDVTNEFADLINKVRELNINDDGILFNQKIKYILENWEKDCNNGEDVEQSFEELHHASLQDAELASKLVLMIASRTFLTKEVHNQNIRLMFLRKLQNNFEGCKQLQNSNPVAFRNSVQMLGEFYHKARLANGQQLTFMATPFISYLEMLLESAQPQDLTLFTTQLYLNGSSIRTESPEKVAEMLNNVKLLLASEGKLCRESRLWLLLATEISNYRFGILPADIHKFYQDQLGDSAMATFQGSHGALSVQTSHTSKTLDSYQSNVNVLQVSTSSDSGIEQNTSPPHNNSTHFNNATTQNYNSSGFSSDSSQNSSMNKQESFGNVNKPGRPILGAGARLNKGKYNEDSSKSNWRDHGKDNSGKWSNKQKNSGGNWNDNKKDHDFPKSGKGWEHDDRFETDYS